jgi:hypothetical protein
VETLADGSKEASLDKEKDLETAVIGRRASARDGVTAEKRAGGADGRLRRTATSLPR